MAHRRYILHTDDITISPQQTLLQPKGFGSTIRNSWLQEPVSNLLRGTQHQKHIVNPSCLQPKTPTPYHLSPLVCIYMKTIAASGCPCHRGVLCDPMLASARTVSRSHGGIAIANCMPATPGRLGAPVCHPMPQAANPMAANPSSAIPANPIAETAMREQPQPNHALFSG